MIVFSMKFWSIGFVIYFVHLHYGFLFKKILFELTWDESSNELFWLPIVCRLTLTFLTSSPEPLGQF
jgi:hypothetical protein